MKFNLIKTVRTIGLVAAALILCILGAHIFTLHEFLADTRTEVREAESLVDSYAAEAAELREANASLQSLNAELQNTNDRLQEALTVYDYDFSIKAPTPPRYLDVPLDEDLQSYIWSLCCNYDIEEHYELIYAMIAVESNFVSDVVSSTNDYGLMQINKCNHDSLSQRLGITDFLDPYQNVHAGIYLIANVLHKYDVPRALMSYNMGEGGAAKLWRQGIHSTHYSKQVLAVYNQITEDI